ncbi:MAG: RsmF rRNA methyltransferase first C-terminal domain-containing protein, partial [Acetatifactor sp.]|nr:RsmF rRNA methyltransferase first C-terminal domain-containing protein [Acetatifactor sp.]
GEFLKFGENLYLMPKGMPQLKGLKVLRPGLQLGAMKKNRFEPSHALALAMAPNEAKYAFYLSSEDKLTRDYLNGLTFPAEGEKGWYLICVDGFSLGWGKLAGGIMKNHYPKGLRK